MKINVKLRQKRISVLEEDIANLDQQISFKEKRRQQSESVRNYKLCEEITHEIGIVKQQRCQLSEELNQYHEKERKAKWYQRSKRKAQKRKRSGSYGDPGGRATRRCLCDDDDATMTMRR